MTGDARRHAPATQRNREPIRQVLAEILPDSGRVLEIAAGSGEHAVHFAAAFPGLSWQPSDPEPAARASIAAWAAEAGLANLAPPLALDAADPDWPARTAPPYDALICINMIHIAPWRACLGLLAGAGRVLAPGGALYLYGPYRRDGAHTAPSNAAFDAGLRAADPEHGVRDLEEVVAVAGRAGLAFDRLVEMPANNLSVIFRRPE